MPLFDCTDEEIKQLKRQRTLTAAGVDQILVGLKPLAILKKIDTRIELIERPAALPPLTPQARRV